MARGLGGSLIAAALASRSADARAEPLTLELIWNAPEACPRAEQVLGAIHQLMGTTETAGVPRLSVQGDIETRGAVLALKLVWRTASMMAERTMESSSCDELARAAALVVALAADPSAVQAVAKESEAHPSEASSAPSPPEGQGPLAGSSTARLASGEDSPLLAYSPEAKPADHSSPLHRTPTTREAARVAGRAQIALDVGSLPRAAEGATVGVSVGLGLVAIQAELGLFLPQYKAIAEGAAELWLSTLSARTCLQWSLASLRVAPCAVAELDLLVGQGQGVDFRQRGAAWFPRLGSGAAFGYPLSKQLAWITEGWLLVGPWRPTFVLQEVVPVHQPNLLVGRWTTGLELRL